MSIRHIKTRDGQEFVGDNSQFIDKGDHYKFSELNDSTVHIIYKMNIMTEKIEADYAWVWVVVAIIVFSIIANKLGCGK